MPLTFIGLPANKDRALSVERDSQQAAALTSKLRFFEAALSAQRSRESATRIRLAKRINRIRAQFANRVQRNVEHRADELLATWTKQFNQLEQSVTGLVEENAVKALQEFLGTCAAADLLKQRLRGQVAAVLARLPNRFTQIKINPSQEISDAAGVEVIKSPDLEMGCAQLVGKSGTVTLDWRASVTVKRGLT